MTCPLNWDVALKEVKGREVQFKRSASPAELAAIGAALGLISCDGLDADIAINPKSMGRYRMSGSLSADVVQACVVSLEPVSEHIEDDFDVEFRPDVPAAVGNPKTDQPVFAVQDVEPIEGNQLDIGRIIFEHLSAALDPYPRKPGAEFQWQENDAIGAAGTRDNPFAVLKSLSIDPEASTKKK